MKQQFYKIIALAMILDGYSIHAQNIANPDFETYSTCPTGQTQLTRATGWTRPTGGTSDYFNDCGYNISTTLSPEDGAGFAGGYMELTYSPSGLTNYKEYITNHLSAPLVAGTTYTFSFYIAHLYGISPSNMLPSAIAYADLPAVEQGYIGAVFSMASPTTSNTQSGSSSFGATSIVDTFGSGRVLIPATDTSVYGAASRNAWVQVTLEYTAVGGEEYMTVGQFRPGTTSLPDSTAAYYFFDNFTAALIPLPVTLEYFAASKQGNAALLKWSTAAERNNKGFEIQRSTDGTNWINTGFVSSKALEGNSAAKITYTYTDASPLNGINLYRLNQIDMDGKQQYSSVQSLSFGRNTAIGLYPNPIKSKLFISGLSGASTIKLITLYGQTIRTMTVTGADTQLDLSSLASGVYSLLIVNSEGITTLKIIKE